MDIIQPSIREKKPEVMDSQAMQAWLKQFEHAKGRPLRVLHIGNIANNAYINAKIMRRNGIEADVLCANYYHIMGTPEWEDADFKGKIKDPFYPDWHNVDLNGFKRPEWFIQGRMTVALNILLSRARNKKIKLKIYQFLNYLQLNLLQNKNIKSRILNFIIKGTYFFKKALSNPLRLKLKRKKLFIIENHQEENIGLHQDASYIAADLIRLAQKVFSYYDVIQAYALDGVYPFLSGFPYAAYEHGTIRDIPFKNDPQGRICKATYQNASMVFITNTDNVKSAKRLNIAEDKIIKIPHAFDSEKCLNFLKQYQGKQTARADKIIFFAPARHSWAIKGNDQLIHAISLVAKQYQNFQVKMITWGDDLAKSKELIKNLQIEKFIVWSSELNKRDLWQAIVASSAVIDQFIIPAMGGVSFETLALGVRLITHLDKAVQADFFGEAPPALEAKSISEIAQRMLMVINDPEDTKKIGDKSIIWSKDYHSSEVILAKHILAYKQMLAMY